MESYAFRVKSSTFPNKLWFLVNDPLIKSICWDASGETILICEETFTVEVLFSPDQFRNSIFKTKDFTSIVRQLNIYGFRKLSSDHIIPEEQLSPTSNVARTPSLSHPKVMQHFTNPNFKRSKPELLVNLKRRVCVKAKHDAETNRPRQSSRHSHNGTVSVDPPQTPFPQHGVTESDGTPYISQAFAVGHGSHGSSSQQGSQSTGPTGLLGPSIPNSVHYSYNTPVYPFLSPQFFQQQAASYPPYGYYPAPASFVYRTPLEGQHQ